MAKPASYRCNLACEYCFYLEQGRGARRDQAPGYQMADNVLQQYVRRVIDATPGDEVIFTWQGGEPTLSGLPFFRRARALQTRYAGGKRILNQMQTNGVLIDDQWARFLAQERFLVGVSLDGPRRLHDALRYNRAGRSVFSRVLNGIACLRRHGVEFNVLATVNQITARHPLEVYRFLTGELQAEVIQFIPVLEPDRRRMAQARRFGEMVFTQRPLAMPWSVDASGWGRFLIAVFDEWVRRDVGRVFVQMFDNTLAAWLGQTPALCAMRADCGAALVMEQNGDIYSCDHFVSPRHRLGNILTDRPDRLAAGKAQRAFGAAKRPASERCRHCAFLAVCQGGCPKHRLSRDGGQPHNALCEGYYAFFRHVTPYMNVMADCLRRRQPVTPVMRLAPWIAARQSRLTR